MTGHEPISDAGLLLGSIFVAVSIVGIGILGDQQGPQQMAGVQGSAMLAAASAPTDPCMVEIPGQATGPGKDYKCLPGCTYTVQVSWFSSASPVVPSGKPSKTKEPPGEVWYKPLVGGKKGPFICPAEGGSVGQTAQLNVNDLNTLGRYFVAGESAPALDTSISANKGILGDWSAQPNSGITPNSTYSNDAFGSLPGTAGQSQFSACPGSSNSGDIKCYVQNGTQYTYSLSNWIQSGGTAANAPGVGSTPDGLTSLQGATPGATVPSTISTVPRSGYTNPNWNGKIDLNPYNIEQEGSFIASPSPTPCGDNVENPCLSTPASPSTVSTNIYDEAHAKACAQNPSACIGGPAVSASTNPGNTDPLLEPGITNGQPPQGFKLVEKSPPAILPPKSAESPFCLATDKACIEQTMNCRSRVFSWLAWAC